MTDLTDVLVFFSMWSSLKSNLFKFVTLLWGFELASICVWHFVTHLSRGDVVALVLTEKPMVPFYVTSFSHPCIKSVSAVFSTKVCVALLHGTVLNRLFPNEDMNWRSCAFFFNPNYSYRTVFGLCDTDSVSDEQAARIKASKKKKKKSTRNFLWWFSTVGGHYYVLVGVKLCLICFFFQLCLFSYLKRILM